MVERIDLLKNRLSETDLFRSLPPGALQKIAEATRSKRLEAEAFYFQEGDPAEAVYVLVEGKLRLVKVTPEGQQVILRYVAPVESFGVVAVLSEAEFPVSAQAVEPSLALVWSKATIDQLMQAIPQIAVNGLSILAERVREFQQRVVEMSTERVERRIARALLRLARQTGRKTDEGVLIDMPLSRQDLAEMTGTTLYTVSRMLSHWESQGLIHSGRERIVILFPHGLVAIAEDLPRSTE